MARNRHAAAGLLIVLALFGLAAWFVFMPAEPAPLTVAEDEAAAEVEGAEAEGATPDALPTQTPSHAVEPSESTTPEREELASVPEGAIVVRAVDPAGVAVADLVIAVGMQIPGQRSAIRFGSGRTDADFGGQPGTVHVSKDTLSVSCGTGTLSLTRIQPQGKPAMPVKDFLNGLRTPIRILG